MQSIEDVISKVIKARALAVAVRRMASGTHAEHEVQQAACVLANEEAELLDEIKRDLWEIGGAKESTESH